MSTQSTNCPKACRKNQTSRKKRKEKKEEKFSLNFHHPYPFKIPVGFAKLLILVITT
jgi:hypothetical protein